MGVEFLFRAVELVLVIPVLEPLLIVGVAGKGSECCPDTVEIELVAQPPGKVVGISFDARFDVPGQVTIIKFF